MGDQDDFFGGNVAIVEHLIKRIHNALSDARGGGVRGGHFLLRDKLKGPGVYRDGVREGSSDVNANTYAAFEFWRRSWPALAPPGGSR